MTEGLSDMGRLFTQADLQLWLFKIRMKTALTVIVIFLTLLALLYFFIYPFYSACLYSSAKISSFGLDDLRNYYLIIGAISGTITALTGITLGFFYYFHKNRVDNEQLLQDKRARLLALLLSEINDYDALVDKILNKEFNTQNELQILRGKIQRKFEMVYLIIEEKNDVLDFSRNTQIDLFDVNKYVDDSKTIMETDYQKIINSEMSKYREEYIDKIIKSRRVCLGA